MRTFRQLISVIGILLCAACAGPAGPSAVPGAGGPPPAPAEPPAVSQFQAWLDRAGIPLRLPPEGKAILVNVPAFELIAFEDAEPVLRSRVIVGSPRNPTPNLDTHVSAVRFRPTWRPTPEMVASGEYRDRRWPSGPNNPLGLAAIRLEPGLLVYLHDTNRRELFQREERALSHGCIRVERWDEVIAWLLGMHLDRVHALAEGSRTFDQPAPPVPVMLRYFTSFPNDEGRLEVFRDVYGLGLSEASADPGGLVVGDEGRQSESCEPLS